MILLVVDVAMVVAIFKTVVVVGVVIAGFVGRVIPVLVLLLVFLSLSRCRTASPQSCLRAGGWID